MQYRQPMTVKALQRFLGMLNFYRRFLPGIAVVLRPLTDALAGTPKRLQWSSQMMSSFNEAKSRLAKATLLVHPKSSAQLRLRTDASEKAVAGSLHQVIGDQEQLPSRVTVHMIWSSSPCTPQSFISDTCSRDATSVSIQIRNPSPERF